MSQNLIWSLLATAIATIIILAIQPVNAWSGYNKNMSDLIQNQIQTKALGDRFNLIMQACADKIQSGDDSLIIPCNKVVLNMNNHTRQVFNESANDINTILYKQ